MLITFLIFGNAYITINNAQTDFDAIKVNLSVENVTNCAFCVMLFKISTYVSS